MTHGRPDPASAHALGLALLEAVDATQDLVLDQVALTKADLRSDAAQLVGHGAVLAAGLTVAVAGHLVVMTGVVVGLSRFLDLIWVLFLVGIPHAAAGVLAAARSARALASLADPESPR